MEVLILGTELMVEQDLMVLHLLQMTNTVLMLSDL